MTLDKEFDSLALKNAGDAKDIIAAIKKTEDKVSKFLCDLIFVKIVPRRFGRNVQEHLGQPFKEDEESGASNLQKVRLGRPNWNNKMKSNKLKHLYKLIVFLKF